VSLFKDKFPDLEEARSLELLELDLDLERLRLQRFLLTELRRFFETALFAEEKSVELTRLSMPSSV
jgi:hypothetical protein